MVAEYAHTTDGSTFSLFDFPPAEAGRAAHTLLEGRQAYLPKTLPNDTGLIETPATDLDLYTLQRDPSSPPIGPINYYGARVASYVLSGPLGQGTSLAVETVDWTASRLPIDELLAVKTQELDDHALFVTYKSVRSTTNNNFWIEVTQRQRERLGSINLVLTDRAKDRALGEDTSIDPALKKPVNTYWARDPRLRLIRDSNGNRLLSGVNEVEWGQAVKDIGLYDDAIEDAYVACTNDFNTHHGAGDWVSLANVDVTSYAWPAFYTGPVSVFINVV